MTTVLSAEAQSFNWLIDKFVDDAPGVTDAVVVSNDGLLMAMSRSLGRDDAEHVSAIVTGFVSLGGSTSACFGFEGLNQVIVAMKGGYMFVSSISDGSALGVVATAGCDIGLVGYQTTLMVERAGSALTPGLITELRASVLT